MLFRKNDHLYLIDNILMENYKLAISKIATITKTEYIISIENPMD